MKIIYRVTEEDYMEARDLFVRNEKWARRLSRRVMPWIGALALLLALAILISGKDRFDAVPLILMGTYCLYCGFAMRRYFRKLYRGDPRFQHEFSADISEDEIHAVTPTADTHLKWNSIVRYLESDKIFMFFYAKWIFSVVPKRAFAAGEIDTFRDLLRRKVPAGL